MFRETVRLGVFYQRKRVQFVIVAVVELARTTRLPEEHDGGIKASRSKAFYTK
jgi:hypothetical protein